MDNAPYPHSRFPPRDLRPGMFPICRVEALRFSADYAECLTGPPSACRYREPLGSRFLCSHPNWKEILKQNE